MKLSLQLKLGRQLTMTPQLQQAIRLLQLSTLDLQQEIHEALESNPMLELDEGAEEEDRRIAELNNDANSAKPDNQETTNQSAQNGEELSWQDQIPNDLAVDSNWDDVYQPSTASQSYDGDSLDFESRNTAVETLQDHLLWPLNLTPM